MELNTDVRKYLIGVSQKCADQKEKIVPITWRSFFDKGLQDINNKTELLQVLYQTQEDFYHEDVHYRDIRKDNVRSNKIKKVLHEVLTKAIFVYRPCQDLLNLCRTKPSPEDWGKDTKKWLMLSSEPYQAVREYIFKIDNNYLHLTHELLL